MCGTNIPYQLDYADNNVNINRGFNSRNNIKSELKKDINGNISNDNNSADNIE